MGGQAQAVDVGRPDEVSPAGGDELDVIVTPGNDAPDTAAALRLTPHSTDLTHVPLCHTTEGLERCSAVYCH